MKEVTGSEMNGFFFFRRFDNDDNNKEPLLQGTDLFPCLNYTIKTSLMLVVHYLKPNWCHVGTKKSFFVMVRYWDVLVPQELGESGSSRPRTWPRSYFRCWKLIGTRFVCDHQKGTFATGGNSDTVERELLKSIKEFSSITGLGLKVLRDGMPLAGGGEIPLTGCTLNGKFSTRDIPLLG